MDIDKAGSPLASRPLRIGLYGCNVNYRTKHLLEGLKDAARGAFEVTAHWDVDPARSELAAKSYGGAACRSEAAFLDRDFDVALISLPPYLHPQAFTHVARAGKDIYMEKPVCVDAAGRQTLIDAAVRYPIRSYIGLSYRFIAPFRKIAEILRRPEAGKLIGMHHHWLTPRYRDEDTPDSNWRNRLETSGGQLVFHCCHVLDWFRWIGGEIRSVTATRYTPPGVRLPHEERELTACLEFVNGGMAVFNLHQHSSQYVQYGTAHAEHTGIRYQWGNDTYVKEYRDRPRAAEATYEWNSSPLPGDGSDHERTMLQMKDFYQAYVSGAPMPCSLADGIRVYDIAMAIRESYSTGRRIDLPDPPELPAP